MWHSLPSKLLKHARIEDARGRSVAVFSREHRACFTDLQKYGHARRGSQRRRQEMGAKTMRNPETFEKRTEKQNESKSTSKTSRVQLKMAARVTHRAVVCQLPERNRSDSPGPSAGRQAREKRRCIRAVPDQRAELPVGPREKRMQRRRPGPSGAVRDV